MKMMDANEIISFIHNSEKSTPVKVYIKGKLDGIDFGKETKHFINGQTGTLFGEWKEIKAALEAHKDLIEDYVIENDRRHSAIPLLDFEKNPGKN